MTQLLNTTVATVVSQTEFTLAAGSNVDDVFNNHSVMLRDVTNSDSPSLGHFAIDWVGATKTLKISKTPNFTVAVGDEVEIILNTNPTQTRVNQPAGRAYRLKLSSNADGTYKATPPVRLRPGAVDVAVSVDMQPQFGDDFVAIVGVPTVSGGSVTATALGPRDTEAMVQLGGTATPQETREVEFLVTMDNGPNGDAVPVTFDVIVFAD